MDGEITGVQDVKHTWPCEWAVLVVDAGMGRRITNHGTLERKRAKEVKHRKYITSTYIKHRARLSETTVVKMKHCSAEHDV